MARSNIIILSLATALFGGCDPADTYYVYEGDEADVYEGDTTTTTTENNYGDSEVETPEPESFLGITANGDLVELTDDLLVTGETWLLEMPNYYGIGNDLEISMRTGLGEATITGVSIEISGTADSAESATLATELTQWDGFSVSRQVGSQEQVIGYRDGSQIDTYSAENEEDWRYWITTRIDVDQAVSPGGTNFEPQIIRELDATVFGVNYWGSDLLPTDTLIQAHISIHYLIDGIEMQPKGVSRSFILHEAE